VRFADPTRRPGQTSEVLRGRLAGPRNMAALGVLSARDMLLPARLVWRSMLRGTLCLPRRCIQAVPEQLAGALPPGTVRGALASGARAAREVLADT